MIFVFLSICCSVIVSVLFKLATRYKIDIYQAIAWNYATAILLSLVFFSPKLNFQLADAPLPIYLSLGILLPSLFIIIGLAIRFTGIVRTDVAQRLSLFVPLLASFLFFQEKLNASKLIGIILGIVAVVFSIPWKQKDDGRQSAYGIIFLFIVFAGMGLIDILFKQVALIKIVPYTGSLFFIYCISFAVSLLMLLFLLITKRSSFQWVNVLCGVILGIFNFGNILFYLKAHQAEALRPSFIFTSMNIGVITVGAIVGLIVFKEKLNLLNKIGIVLAIIAITIIARS